nr:MAG TPA: hypothetical protein [Caudoviricetes sp.]
MANRRMCSCGTPLIDTDHCKCSSKSMVICLRTV